MPDNIKLSIEIKNQAPIELGSLSKSFTSLADEYKRYIASADIKVYGDVKLYIQEIRSGSIIADLVTLAPFALPFFENSNSVIEFSKHIKKSYDYLLGKEAPENKPNLGRQNYTNLSNFIDPIAKDNASQLICNATFNEKVEMHFHLNSLEANAIQNRAKREIEELADPVTGLHTQVLLYWYQARNDTQSTTGDKAIIESISLNPVKTVFANEEIKKEMLSAPENFFKHAYLVDVSVETRQNNPIIYKIIRIHEKIDY